MRDQRAAAAANEISAFHDADEAMHKAISNIAGHPNIWRVVKREKAHIDRVRLLSLQAPGRFKTVIAEHTRIVEGIRARERTPRKPRWRRISVRCCRASIPRATNIPTISKPRRRRRGPAAPPDPERRGAEPCCIPIACCPPIPAALAIARRLYAEVGDLPIVSPHGHTDPRWFAENAPFDNPASLFVTRDHYIYRMLYSQGVRLESLGIPRLDGGAVESDARKIWRLFAENYHLFRGTPTRLWLDHAFETLFGLTERLGAANADAHYDRIAERLTRPNSGRAPCSSDSTSR